MCPRAGRISGDFAATPTPARGILSSRAPCARMRIIGAGNHATPRNWETTPMLIHDLPESCRLHHATRAKAEKLSAILSAEYPILSIHALLNEDESKVVEWHVLATMPGEEEATTVLVSERVPGLAEVLEACEEADIDPETEVEAEEDGEKLSGSVVPEVYRARYREASSNGQTCGDWLAERLVADTHGADGFRVDDFTTILQVNGIDLDNKWGRLPMSGQKGWVGRYRMNGRQVLEKVVAIRGTYIDHSGEQITPDAGWLEAMRSKHAKWIAKEHKKAKEALNLEAA